MVVHVDEAAASACSPLFAIKPGCIRSTAHGALRRSARAHHQGQLGLPVS
ncbi:MAG: hypothetical protein ACLSAH_13240 [Bilophila wadsworthia]